MSDSTRPLVLYHGDCSDGFTAAWVARRHFGDRADYAPVSHGNPPPDVAGREVYVLDFSWKRPAMEGLTAAAARVCVLDHHKTAEQELAYLCDPAASVDDFRAGRSRVCVVFDMEKSGARLAWEHFFPGHKSPWVVDYVEDRDLWRWALPRSREVNAAIASYPKDFELWDAWARVPGYPHGRERNTRNWLAGLECDRRDPDDPDRIGADDDWLSSMVAEGAAILRYQEQEVALACRHAYETEIAGHKVLAANVSAKTLVSAVGERLAKGRPFGATFFVGAGGRRVWSLRSREGGIDVSEVAKKFGGGGHRQAAGYEESPA